MAAMNFTQLSKDPRIKSALIILVLILIVAGFLKLAAGFWIKNSGLNKEINKIKAEIANTGNLAVMQAALDKESGKLTKESKENEKKFFTDIEEVLTRMNRFAQTSDISIRSITPAERVRMEISGRKDISLEMLSLEIRLNCDYKQLLIFLSKIENFDKLIIINDIRIQNNPQDIWNHEVQLKFRIPLLIYAKGQ
jgi:Tfp pilus assembly protein PilO